MENKTEYVAKCKKEKKEKKKAIMQYTTHNYHLNYLILPEAIKL